MLMSIIFVCIGFYIILVFSLELSVSDKCSNIVIDGFGEKLGGITTFDTAILLTYSAKNVLFCNRKNKKMT